MAAARTVTKSTGTAPKGSRSAALKAQAKAPTKKAAVPEGADETIDFSDDTPPVPSKPASKSKAPKAGTEIEVTFVLEKITSGGQGQYCEVDADGDKLPITLAVMGKPYLRKDKIGGTLPKKFTATIRF